MGLEGVRVGSEASQRQQDPERSQDLQLLLSSQGGLVGVTTQSVGGRECSGGALLPISVLPLLHELPFHGLPLSYFLLTFYSLSLPQGNLSCF